MVRPRNLALVLLLAAGAGAGETSADWESWSRARADELERGGRFEDAIEELMSLSQLRPGDVGPVSRAAVLAVEAPLFRGKDLTAGSPMFQLAERFIREGVARGGQGDPGLAYAIGRLRFAESQWGAAWRTLGDARRTGFDPVRARYWHYRATVNRAATLIDAGRAQDVLDELDQLLKSQPGHPEEIYLLVNLAAAHLGMQQPSVGKKILEDLIAKTPGAADAHYLLGVILSNEGRLDEAQSRFRETMLQAQASYQDKTYRNALIRLGDAQLKQGRLDDAESSARQLLSLDKDDALGLYAMGRVKQARGENDAALPLFRRAARLMPDSIDSLINLQQTLHQLGEKSEAEEIGRRAAEVRRKRIADAEGGPAATGTPPKR